ncbi:MAG TPA: hypothetical protein VIR79_05935 [Nitrospira sp.]
MALLKTINMTVVGAAVLGILTISIIPAQAGNGEIRLKAKMVNGAASGQADYRQKGNESRLNVQAEDLPSSAGPSLPVFVGPTNGMAQVGTMILQACPPPAQALLCGELELNTKDGQTVPHVERGYTVTVGNILSGNF